MEDGSFEKKELKIFEYLLSFSDVFVNVGCNVGYFVCNALKNEKRVIAFEPNYLNYQILMQNIIANKWEKKTSVYPLALSNEVSLSQMYGGGTGASLIEGWADQYRSSIVPTNILDNFKNVIQEYNQALILIDIEGHEYNCLLGSKEILSLKRKPIWFVEICFDQNQPNHRKFNPNFLNTFEMFHKYGYSMYAISKTITCLNIKKIREIDRLRINNLDTYNYIFIDTQNKLLNNQLLKV